MYFNILNFIIHFWPIALVLYKVKSKSVLVDEIKNSNEDEVDSTVTSINDVYTETSDVNNSEN